MKVLTRSHYDWLLSKIVREKVHQVFQVFSNGGGLVLVRSFDLLSGKTLESYRMDKDVLVTRRRIARATAKRPIKLNQTILFHTL